MKHLNINEDFKKYQKLSSKDQESDQLMVFLKTQTMVSIIMVVVFLMTVCSFIVGIVSQHMYVLCSGFALTYIVYVFLLRKLTNIKTPKELIKSKIPQNLINDNFEEAFNFNDPLTKKVFVDKQAYINERILKDKGFSNGLIFEILDEIGLLISESKANELERIKQETIQEEKEALINSDTKLGKILSKVQKITNYKVNHDI